MNANDPIRPHRHDSEDGALPLLQTSEPALWSLPSATQLSKLHHDIRTALYQVIGYIEILLEDAEEQNRHDILLALREAHAEAKSTQYVLSALLFVPQEASEPRLRELHDCLVEAGGKMIAHGCELERLAGVAAGDGLRSDLQRFQAAAHNLLQSANLIGAQSIPEELDPGLVPASVRAMSSESARFGPPLLPSKAEETRGSGLLLVVDDGEANRDLLGRRLERQGYKVLVAEDGKRALEMANERNLDLILLDVMMPHMDGISVLRELKADPRLRDIPVIMISSLSEIQSVVRCIEIGAEDYLSKPFDPVLLRARVGSLLERKRLREQEQRKNEELQSAFLEIQRQKQVAEGLLLNILPESVAVELRVKGFVEPTYFEDITIVFADFVGFTLATEKLPADQLVHVLHEYFTAFDRITAKYELEKLKTIGDCYMFVGGMPSRSSSHPVEAVLAALEMVDVARKMASSLGLVPWQLRVGIHTGPVIAGVVGIRKFAFDIWGDSVNLSYRMESSSAPDRVNISAATYARVKDFFACEHRGKIKTKGGHKQDMYFVGGVASSLLDDNNQPAIGAFGSRYRTYFQKELRSFPECLLKQ